MLKRVVVNIMQNIAPAFVVLCVFLCLSFSCTFPLHRVRPNNWAELFNRSQKCRSKKMTPSATDEKPAIESQDFSKTYNQYAEAKRKLSGDDLRHYEQMVIMKKYPYLDLKEFEIKFNPSSIKNVKYAREPEVAAAAECKLIDDGPHVEIFSRGISGFAIPKNPNKVVEKPKQNVEHVERNLKLARNSRSWHSLKENEGSDELVS